LSQGRDDVTGEPLVQRIDDQPGTVLARLKVYTETVTPVVDFFRNRGVLVDFHARQTNVLWPHVEAYLRGMFANMSANIDSVKQG
jgi:nucleoside-triphosphate--adenylate kinase